MILRSTARHPDVMLHTVPWPARPDSTEAANTRGNSLKESGVHLCLSICLSICLSVCLWRYTKPMKRQGRWGGPLQYSVVIKAYGGGPVQWGLRPRNRRAQQQGYGLANGDVVPSPHRASRMASQIASFARTYSQAKKQTKNWRNPMHCRMCTIVPRRHTYSSIHLNPLAALASARTRNYQSQWDKVVRVRKFESWLMTANRIIISVTCVRGSRARTSVSPALPAQGGRTGRLCSCARAPPQRKSGPAPAAAAKAPRRGQNGTPRRRRHAAGPEGPARQKSTKLGHANPDAPRVQRGPARQKLAKLGPTVPDAPRVQRAPAWQKSAKLGSGATRAQRKPQRDSGDVSY
jgi:hypothetical protein